MGIYVYGDYNMTNVIHLLEIYVGYLWIFIFMN